MAGIAKISVWMLAFGYVTDAILHSGRIQLCFHAPFSPVCKKHLGSPHIFHGGNRIFCPAPQISKFGMSKICRACLYRNEFENLFPDDVTLQLTLPTGPPLRILSVSEDSLSSIAFEPTRDIKISAANGWGDGHHATTSLCLSFLADHAGPGKVSDRITPLSAQPPNEEGLRRRCWTSVRAAASSPSQGMCSAAPTLWASTSTTTHWRPLPPTSTATASPTAR